MIVAGIVVAVVLLVAMRFYLLDAPVSAIVAAGVGAWAITAGVLGPIAGGILLFNRKKG